MTDEVEEHIADINFENFYRPAFPSLGESQVFHERLKALSPPNNKPLVLYHQAGRMIWLGDRIDTVAAGRPPFQVLFYIIAAELAAKIAFGFQGEGRSREHVRRFFEEICSERHRTRLATAFHRVAGAYLSCREAIDFLYDVRCDVVHEGRYYSLNLRTPESQFPMMTGRGDNGPITDISLPELRAIVLEGSVLACRKLAPS